MTRAIAVVAILLAVAACGSKSLAETDPHAYAACSALSRSATTTDGKTSLDTMLQAGEEAQQASTEAIRSASKDLVAGMALPDIDALRKACSANGFKVPPAVSKSS